MSKKKGKKYIIAELDEDNIISKQFIAESKDGLIIGDSKADGDHYTVLLKDEDITIHKTEIQPNGSKKYHFSKDFFDLFNIVQDNLIICKTPTEILNMVSKDSLVFPMQKDFENKDIVEEENNVSKLKVKNLFKLAFERLENSELIDNKNIDSIIKSNPKGFCIADIENENYFIVLPQENSFKVFDIKKFQEDVIQFFHLKLGIEKETQDELLKILTNQFLK